VKCRCVHRVSWFIACPWCKAETYRPAYGYDSRYPLWFRLTPEQAANEAEHQIMLAAGRW